MSHAPGTCLGPYEILSPLGAGGMGEVYKARDTRLGREVAVKVLPAEFAAHPERLRRFELEARAAAALNHPNILVLHDLGTHDGAPYIVTELLEGETLRQRLRSGPLPPVKAVEFGVQIAQGLSAAHEKGIVHRDLKPENLFLTHDGRVKILDFGLARLRSEGLLPEAQYTQAPTEDRPTGGGRLVGTLSYMSPEQARGLMADHRSDLFSLGGVLYEMLSGRRPFEGATSTDVAVAILREDPPPLPPRLSPALSRIVRQCLEKRPEDRFQSAHDLALALQALTGNEELSSVARLEPAEQAGWLRRHRGFLGLAAVGAVLAALALTFWVGGLPRKGDSEEPAIAAPIRSIAVLPLANLSGNPDQAYFADGMTDALIAQLYKISGFEKVISRTSVMQYKETRKTLPEIGRELGVEALLEGSVQRAGGRVRITVQLIDAKSDRHLWAESYDREMSDVLNLQSDIALAVAKQIKVVLTPAEVKRVGRRQSVDPETYDDFLKASNLLYCGGGEASILEALAQLERLVTRNPGFAPAWARLGDAYLFKGELTCGPPAESYARAKAALDKALVLEPDLVLALVNLAYFKLTWEWDWEGAGQYLARSLELDPNNVDVLRNYGPYLTAMRRFDESIKNRRRLILLDPSNPAAWNNLAQDLLVTKRYQEALDLARDMLRRNPESQAGLSITFTAQLFLGNRQEALATLERERAAYAKGKPSYAYSALLAQDFALAGQRKEALAIGRQIEAEDPCKHLIGTRLAPIYIFLSDNDSAMRWLDYAYAHRDPNLSGWYGIADGFPESFRKDPRFIALLCKMKFSGACEGMP